MSWHSYIVLIWKHLELNQLALQAMDYNSVENFIQNKIWSVHKIIMHRYITIYAHNIYILWLYIYHSYVVCIQILIEALVICQCVQLYDPKNY